MGTDKQSVDKPLLLCMDSSTPAGSVALVAGATVVAEISLNVKQRSHSDYLLRYVEFLLDESNMSLDDLDGIAVVVGPGSFTGLRVGLATVQGLSQVNSLPIYPVSSLQCVAFANGAVDMPLQVLIDARKQEVYTATYYWHDGIPELQGVEQVMLPSLLMQQIQTRTRLVGNGVTEYWDVIKEFAGATELVLLANQVNLHPCASAAGLLVNALGQRAAKQSCFELQPVYVRLSDAEMQKNSR